jgi:hypothetical protein
MGMGRKERRVKGSEGGCRVQNRVNPKGGPVRKKGQRETNDIK